MWRYKHGNNIHIKVWRHTFQAFESGDFADLSISINNPISVQPWNWLETSREMKQLHAQCLIKFSFLFDINIKENIRVTKFIFLFTQFSIRENY